MTRPLLWSRDPGGGSEYPWRWPFRLAVRHLRLGAWDVRVLDQRRVWVDSAAVVHRLGELSDEHLANIIIVLRVHALEIMLDYSVSAGLGRIKPKASLPGMTGSVKQVALDWISSTRLWDALQEQASARARRRPGTTLSLESQTGAWAVRTENSTYVLDLDHSRAVRLAEVAAGQLRRDQQWTVLCAHGLIRVGQQAGLEVKVSDDPGVAVTIRVTSPVVAIHHLAAPPGASEGDLVDLARAVTSPERSEHRVADPLTEYRTAKFRATAGDIRVFWAALDVLLTRHHAMGALIVPRRLRDPGADPADADLFVGHIQGGEVQGLQRDVTDAMGYHLPVTELGDYPGRTLADVATHAMVLAPGW